MLSQSDCISYSRSAPGEYWSGVLLRDGYADHVAEVPNWTASDVYVEGFENGDTGWGFWRAKLKFTERGNERDVRFSIVLTLEDGLWRIVQSHCSTTVPNMDIMGFEHFAFDDLIAAVRSADGQIEGEGSAVIMFTDVARSTEIAHSVGDRKWAVAIGQLLDLKAKEIANQNGSLVKTLGDGTMSSFQSAGSAMRAAKAIQSAVQKSDNDPKLEIRIGIHAGDVVETEGDFFGTVVNKAARIAALAEPNEILVSDIACAMAGDRTEFTFTDPITVALRGIERQHSISGLDWTGRESPTRAT